MKNYCWKLSELHIAIALLLEKNCYPNPNTNTNNEYIIPSLNDNTTSSELSRWLEHISSLSGVDIQEVSILYGGLAQSIKKISPAILPMGNDGFVILLGSNWRGVQVLGKDSRVYKCSFKTIQDALSSSLETPILSQLEQTITSLELTKRRHEKVMSSLLLQQLADKSVGNCFLLRPSVGESFWKQLCHAAVPQQMLVFICCLLASQILMILGWMVIGETVFHHTGFNGMIELWALLLFTAVPLQVLSLRIKNGLSLDVGYLLRKRLFEGILNLKADDVRHQGSGSFLGQIMNVEFLEGQCLSMVFVSIMSLVSLCLAMYVLII
ncbi:MAG: hypothetical protein R8L53_03210, partial [Mariprofundales bacterium]